MQDCIILSQGEIGLLESALDEIVNVLRNRFEDDPLFVHPAKKYEDLRDRLTGFLEPLPVGHYTLQQTPQ